LLLLSIGLLAGSGPAWASEPGPVGIHIAGENAWVAFGAAIHHIDLQHRESPALVHAAPEPGAKMKAVATGGDGSLTLFIVSQRNRTSIHGLSRNGTSVELKATTKSSQWKNLALAEDGTRAWAADMRGNQIREFRLDPGVPAIRSERALLEVESPYNVTHLPDGGGLLIVTQDDHLLWADFEGRVLDDWDLAKACRYNVENRGPLRAAVRNAATGTLYALNHRSVLALTPGARHGEPLASCAIVAGHPTEKGFIDSCGERARFSHPHDLALADDGSAAFVTDTDNDVLRRISLEPGAGYGCVSTIPLAERPTAASKKSCSELDWPTRTSFDRDGSVCAGPTGEARCGEPLGFEAARDACHARGARLCSHFELAADEARASGCNTDERWVWSSTPCRRVSPSGRFRWDAGAIAQAGASLGLAAKPPSCRADGQAHLRCCADAR